MSMSKRLLFDRNPLDEPVRERMRREAAAFLEPFKYRIALKRRNRAAHPYWDVSWRMSVSRAARELGFEVVTINDGLFTREMSERDAILARAEVLWRQSR